MYEVVGVVLVVLLPSPFFLECMNEFLCIFAVLRMFENSRCIGGRKIYAYLVIYFSVIIVLIEHSASLEWM